MPRRLLGRWRIRWWAGLLLGLSLLYVIQPLPLGQRIDLYLFPLVDALQAPVRWWEHARLWLTRQQQLTAENRQLREALERQAGNRQELRALRAENRQLRALLKLKDIRGFHWRAAQVLGRSPDEMSQRLLLLAQESPPTGSIVVSRDGLVGLVAETRGRRAVVRTILDASLSVPVTLPGSRLAALVRGQGERLRVDFVPLADAPAPGRALVTSGAGGVFPPGIPVARVTRVRPVAGSLFAEVEADPVASWRRDAWLSIASRIEPRNASGTPSP
jgi:rod shape-determining protein MreC